MGGWGSFFPFQYNLRGENLRNKKKCVVGALVYSISLRLRVNRGTQILRKNKRVKLFWRLLFFVGGAPNFMGGPQILILLKLIPPSILIKFVFLWLAPFLFMGHLMCFGY